MVMFKTILYERTVALCASMDLGKGLGRSERWGGSCWSIVEEGDYEDKNPYSKYFGKNYEKVVSYAVVTCSISHLFVKPNTQNNYDNI